jgi:hypothetical protein
LIAAVQANASTRGSIPAAEKIATFCKISGKGATEAYPWNWDRFREEYIMKVARCLSVLLVISLVGAGNAWADRGHRGGGHRGGHFGTWAGIGLTALVLGAALAPRPVYATSPYYPAYYPAYYPPLVVEPAATVYSEPMPSYAPPPVARSQRSTDWYYCPAAKAYYPYVRECASGWQRVPARPADY